MVCSKPLTVWSVCIGDKYTDQDVQILQRMVSANLSIPHRFRCLSDRSRKGVDCLIPEEIWPGWWSKLLLFKYAAGQCLYFDLDVVITGNLDDLLSETLSMPSNWAQSGHGGCQSSVMSWGLPYPQLYESFDVGRLAQPESGNCGRYDGLWGDQEYITKMMGPPGYQIHPMKGVYSYKYHCRGGPPKDAKVVAFHGDPKPGAVLDQWVKNSRFTSIAA